MRISLVVVECGSSSVIIYNIVEFNFSSSREVVVVGNSNIINIYYIVRINFS